MPDDTTEYDEAVEWPKVSRLAIWALKHHPPSRGVAGALIGLGWDDKDIDQEARIGGLIGLRAWADRGRDKARSTYVIKNVYWHLYRLLTHPSHGFKRDLSRLAGQAPVTAGGHGNLLDALDLIARDNPDVLPAAELRAALATAFRYMDKRLLAILEFRYGLSGGEPLTLEETADALGKIEGKRVTRERIRQIETRALDWFKDLLEAKGSVVRGLNAFRDGLDDLHPDEPYESYDRKYDTLLHALRNSPLAGDVVRLFWRHGAMTFERAAREREKLGAPPVSVAALKRAVWDAATYNGLLPPEILKKTVSGGDVYRVNGALETYVGLRAADPSPEALEAVLSHRASNADPDPGHPLASYVRFWPESVTSPPARRARYAEEVVPTVVIDPGEPVSKAVITLEEKNGVSVEVAKSGDHWRNADDLGRMWRAAAEYLQDLLAKVGLKGRFQLVPIGMGRWDDDQPAARIKVSASNVGWVRCFIRPGEPATTFEYRLVAMDGQVDHETLRQVIYTEIGRLRSAVKKKMLDAAEAQAARNAAQQPVAVKRPAVLPPPAERQAPLNGRPPDWLATELGVCDKQIVEAERRLEELRAWRDELLAEAAKAPPPKPKSEDPLDMFMDALALFS